MVSSSDRKRLSAPSLMMKPAKVVATPVRVMTPMITPTKAQATPTGRAWRAPSASALTASCSVSRPPLTNRQTRTSTPTTAKNTPTPNLKKAALASPSAIQKAKRKPVKVSRAATATPRMRMAVSASPTVPENSGV